MINDSYLNTLTNKALIDKTFGENLLKTKAYQSKNDTESFDKILRFDGNGTKNKETELKKLREQTDAFEAIMIKSVLDISLKQDVSLFPKAVGSDIYSDMYNDAISKSIGGGLGFSDLLFDFLKENV